MNDVRNTRKKKQIQKKHKKEIKQTANREDGESKVCDHNHDIKWLQKEELPPELMNLGTRIPQRHTDHEPIEQPFPLF
jgi:hypothetical protein